MVLNLAQRPTGSFAALQHLLGRQRRDEAAEQALAARAEAIQESLVAADIIEVDEVDGQQNSAWWPTYPRTSR